MLPPPAHRHGLPEAGVRAPERLVASTYLPAAPHFEEPRHHGSHRPRPGSPRPALRAHDPPALDGRRPARDLRPPGHAHGARPARPPALHPAHEARPAGARLGGPRPLRAVVRPCVDAPLLAAAPERL